MFYVDKYKTISLYQKLNEIKRNNILSTVISKIIVSNGKDEENLNVLTIIIGRDNDSKEIIKSREEEIKTILKFCIENVSDEFLHISSLDFISSLFRKSSDLVLDVIELDTIFEMGHDFARIYSFKRLIWKLGRLDIDFGQVKEEIANDFVLAFIPVLDMSFGNYDRISTLRIIEKLWMHLNDETKNMLIQKIKKILWDKSEPGYLNKMMLVDFLVRNYTNFNTSDKNNIKEMFRDYLNLKDRHHYYIYNEVKNACVNLMN